jgi:redox-sensitive bicupin YhaK (pirin superfamily)
VEFVAEPKLKTLVDVFRNAQSHWVGDGFPVRTVLSYDQYGQELSPFLLLDYAGPYDFEAAARPRGVGPHPHRGFDAVTLVYDGEVAHRDSTGSGGIIGPGDVQWMTAGAGIVHQEFHSPAFTKRGGVFCVVQLWVNLPASRKSAPPRYQPIKAETIPFVSLPGGAGGARVIAGSLGGQAGPAKTFTPVNVFDLELQSGGRARIDAPEGHTCLVVVLSGVLDFDGKTQVRDAEGAAFSRDGATIMLSPKMPTKALVLTGAPIEEPIVGRGPFVMNTEAEIRQAFRDFTSGRFGRIRTNANV